THTQDIMPLDIQVSFYESCDQSVTEPPRSRDAVTMRRPERRSCRHAECTKWVTVRNWTTEENAKHLIPLGKAHQVLEQDGPALNAPIWQNVTHKDETRLANHLFDTPQRWAPSF